MNAKKTGKLVLSAASASLVGDATYCDDRIARTLFYGLRLTVTANTLVGTLTFVTSADPVDDDPALSPQIVATQPVLVAPNALPSGITNASGVITFATAAIGTHRLIFRIDDPPPVVIPKYVFTSGGGTVSLKLKAWY